MATIVRMPSLTSADACQEHRLFHCDGEVAGKARILGDITNQAAGLSRRVAKDADATGLGLQQAQDEFKQGTLATGVGTDDAQKLAGAHLQVHALQDRHVAISKTQAPDADDRVRDRHGRGSG